MKALCFIILMLAASSIVQAQRTARDAFQPVLLQTDNEQDPAYPLYKEGYSLILKDRWTDALRKFQELRAKYPKSEYTDDAAYWAAYAQKRLDRKKGIEAYEKFLAEFSDSKYVDDAIADMRDDIVIVAPEGRNLQVKVSPGAYAYSYGTTMRAGERALREAERAMRHAQYKMRRMDVRLGKLLPSPVINRRDADLDPQTRIRMDALQALAESENDRDAYLALKDVALDRSQPTALRVTAVEALPRFQRFDPLGTLLDVARSDTSEDVQLTAIYAIADLNAEKNKAADALIALFRSLPKQNEKHLETTLYAIAEIGNDRAVDFLATVATTHENLSLRSDAVYYLGTIGSEKSRAALLKILKGK
jgi:tetratricopeptide (TPR) repeat protein